MSCIEIYGYKPSQLWKEDVGPLIKHYNTIYSKSSLKIEGLWTFIEDAKYKTLAKYFNRVSFKILKEKKTTDEYFVTFDKWLTGA